MLRVDSATAGGASQSGTALPARPRLVPGLTVLQTEEGIVIDGGLEPLVLRGRSATDVVMPLLGLLDGNATMEALAAERKVHPRVIGSTLRALQTYGLLEEGANPAAGESARDTFLARAARINPDATATGRGVERLAEARVIVVGGGTEVSDTVRRILLADGLGDARVMNADEPTSLIEGATLMVGLEWLGEQPTLGRAFDAARTACVPFLPVAYDEASVELGPLFAPRGNTMCYHCLSRRRGGDRTHKCPDEAACSIAAGIAALEVTRLVSGAGDCRTRQGIVRLELATLTEAVLVRGRDPSCGACLRDAGTPVDSSALTEDGRVADLYECAIEVDEAAIHAIPARDLLHLRRNKALMYDHKRYWTAPLVRLENDDLAAACRDDQPERHCRVETLARILARAGGLRDPLTTRAGSQTVERWAPTGGNLGSVQLYVRTTEVSGIDDGWYFYLPFEPALAKLLTPDSEERFASLWSGLAGLDFEPSAVFVLTAGLARVRAKYGSSAAKLVHLDAGFALALLLAAAERHGMTGRVASEWPDDALAEYLDIDPDEEPVTAIAAVGRRAQ